MLGGEGGKEEKERKEPWRWPAARPWGTEEVACGGEIPGRRSGVGRRPEAGGGE